MSEHITVAVGEASFGQGSGPIILERVACSGTESNLTQCGHNGIGNHACAHSKDAGVICLGNHNIIMGIHVTIRFIVCMV